MNIIFTIKNDINLYEMIYTPMLYSFYDNKTLEDEIFEKNIEQLMKVSGDFVKSKNFITECIIKTANEYLGCSCGYRYIEKVKDVLSLFGVFNNNDNELLLTDGYYSFNFKNNTIYYKNMPLINAYSDLRLISTELIVGINLMKFNKIIITNVNRNKLLKVITENNIKDIRKLNREYIDKYVENIYNNEVSTFDLEVEIAYSNLCYSDIKTILINYLNLNNFKKYLKTGRV